MCVSHRVAEAGAALHGLEGARRDRLPQLPLGLSASTARDVPRDTPPWRCRDAVTDSHVHITIMVAPPVRVLTASPTGLQLFRQAS